MLYLALDSAYPFNDDYLDRNPMTKLPASVKTDGRYVVDYFGRELSRDNMPSNLEWLGDEVDETREIGNDGHTLIWDDDLWEKYRRNSHDIKEQRAECVTPRGVLKKMYYMVYGTMPSDEIDGNGNGDFDWFFQKGNVYSDSDKSKFSKYANLHLGRAWDVMSAREYHELSETSSSKTDTKYTKPAI